MTDRCYIGLASTMHDPAIAIVDSSGEPVFAEAAERYLQVKRAYNCPPDEMLRTPRLVEEYCGDSEIVAALSWSSGFGADLNRLLATHDLPSPTDFTTDEFSWPLPNPKALLRAMGNSVNQAALNLISSELIPNRITLRRSDHHSTHAAMAAYTSPFAECVVAIIDGYGEASSVGVFHYHDGVLEPIRVARAASESPVASLGYLYSKLCAFCGFDPIAGEEWKVMGLAAYGSFDQSLYDLLSPLVEVDGIGLRSGCSADEVTRRLARLRRQVRPTSSSPREAADLAHTGQRLFEERALELVQNVYGLELSDNVAIGGGCALNSSFNGRIVQNTGFTALHVPSAPADDGNALGAALLAYHQDHPGVGPPCRTQHPYLGSRLDPAGIARLDRHGRVGRRSDLRQVGVGKVADLLAEGKIVGWVQGRAEFGPRALGNRSILANPTIPDIKDRLNGEVKFREEFRPFAPSILDEAGSDYFIAYQTSPYMERALRFRPGAARRVPGVVHTDGTGRLQSVRPEWNPRFHDLLSAFEDRTGVPVVLNTSFNLMGKPIIHSVEDALGVFLTSGLDVLVLDDLIIEK